MSPALFMLREIFKINMLDVYYVFGHLCFSDDQKNNKVVCIYIYIYVYIYMYVCVCVYMYIIIYFSEP